MLAASMPRLKAQRTLDEDKTGKIRLHPETLYDVVLAATGSVTLANAYRMARIEADKPKK